LPFNACDLLAGFTFTCEEFEGKNKRRVWDGAITLLESDMRRVGIQLAKSYCGAIRHSESHRYDSHFESDAASIKEAAA
jgi:hypothetical protein